MGNGRIIRPEQGETMLELPEIGRLHIGIKNEKGYPQSIDWFRATGKYAALFTKALGDKPNTIQIMFYSDEATKVCNERYEYRDNAGALVAYGDGETFNVWDGKIYKPYYIKDFPDLMNQIAAKNPTKRGNDNWDIVLTMRFIIPAVNGVVGAWGFTTKGKASSIRNIRDSFDSVQMMRGTVVTSVFDLSVQFHKSNKPNDSSRYPVLSLVANDNRIEDVRQMIQQKENLSLLLPNKNE